MAWGIIPFLLLSQTANTDVKIEDFLKKTGGDSLWVYYYVNSNENADAAFQNALGCVNTHVANTRGKRLNFERIWADYKLSRNREKTGWHKARICDYGNKSVKGEQYVILEPKFVKKDTTITIPNIKIEQKDTTITNYNIKIEQRDTTLTDYVEKPKEETHEKGFFRLDKDKSIDRFDFGFGVGHRKTDGINLWLAPIVAINLHNVNKAKEGKPRVAANLEWAFLTGNVEGKNLLNVGADIYNPWISGGFFITLDSADVATLYGKVGGALDLNPVVVSGDYAAGIDNNMKIKHRARGALDYNSKNFGLNLYGRSGENKYGVYTNLGGADFRFGDKVRLLLGANYETAKGMEFFNDNEPVGNAGEGEFGFRSGVHWLFDNKTGLYLMGDIKAAKDQDEKAKIVDESAKLGITYHF